MKTIHWYVQKVLDDFQWEIDRHEFDEMMAAKKGSRSRTRWDSKKYPQGGAGGLGSQFLFSVFKVHHQMHAPSSEMHLDQATG